MGFQNGLSGLNASAKNLDVIGHNIANANTTGFKASRSEFAAMVASSIGAAGGRSSGMGVDVAAVAQQFKQGPISTTGNSLDVAINGNGFFALQQPDGSRAYTRAGNFKLHAGTGDIMTTSGARVLGYAVDPLTGKRTSGTLEPMRLPTGAPIEAKQTTAIQAALNLDARATDAAGDPNATPPIPATPRSTYGTSVTVYDSQGSPQIVNLYFEKNGANKWDVYTELDDPDATPPVKASPIGTLEFDNNGHIIGPKQQPPATGFGLNFKVSPAAPNPNNLPDFDVDLNLDGMTQFGSKFNTSELTQDGYASGTLTDVDIGEDGLIMGIYSNGVTRAEGQLALAGFRNSQGLEPIGDNNWVETSASGQPMLGVPTDSNFGKLRGQALEESNVDLTAELVGMMTAQRAYQANAQTIKTQDQVMSTLVNLR